MKQFTVFTGTREQQVQIPKNNFLYCADHPVYTPELCESELIQKAVQNPIGSEGLSAIPRNAKVAIIVDDATRPTPGARIMPHIMHEVEKKTQNITFITAPGTHRPLTQAELEIKIGRQYLDRYPVFNLDYTKTEEYRYIGDTELGTPLHIHHAVLDAEYKIAVGNIGPHNVVGWSGGAKMLQPGVSGEITTSSTHVRGSHYRLLDIFGNLDCAMRKEVDAIGERVGLDFIANTVLDMKKNVLGLFCGHFLHAHRAGVAFAEKMLRPAIPSLADVVIVSAYPCYFDYWQGLKPVAFSMFGVKPGGTIIYLFDPPEGLIGNSPSHRQALYSYLKTDTKTVMKDLADEKVEDQVGVTNPLCHFQILEHANVLCVTNSLSQDECDLLRFKRYDTVEQALEKALEQQGKQAKVGLIPFGGETLVRVEKE